MQTQTPAVIDIEASGFGAKSYPIEIGFVDEKSNPHCFLIEPEWNWKHWDDAAEALHGISQQLLKDYGRTATDVAIYMNGILQGKTVYSDAWSHDMSWLGKLFDAVDLPQHFRVASLLELLTEEQRDRWDEVKKTVIEEFDLRRHRASSDARIIQETYKRVVLDA